MFIRNMWYVAAWTTELNDAPLSCTIINEPIVIWRRADRGLVAMEDRCAHRHAPLSLGRVEGDAIRCMYHGLKFDSVGQCLELPGSDRPPACAIRTFPVVEKNSWIWIWMGNAAGADEHDIPAAYGLDDPKWLMNASAIDYAADYQLLNDNLTDLSHLDFVHENSLGTSTGYDWHRAQPKVTTGDKGLTVTRWLGPQHAKDDGPASKSDTFNRYRYHLPGIFVMHTKMFPHGAAEASGFGDPGAPPLMELVEQQAVTPVGPGRSRYFFATGIGSQYGVPADAVERRAIADRAFAEDQVMIEAQQRIWDLTTPDKPKCFIPSDKAPSIFRRLILRRIELEQS